MGKKEQRRAAIALRAKLSPEEREKSSLEICRRLLKLPEIENARVILSYMAFGDEADMGLFNKEAIKLGKRLCFPVSRPGGIMEAYFPGEMKKGRFGISEPDESCSQLCPEEKIDVIIAPCLAFDISGTRLGHGCGYYDRFLPACRNVKYIAAAFEAQRMEALECDELDFRLSAAVSEKKVYRF